MLSSRSPPGILVLLFVEVEKVVFRRAMKGNEERLMPRQS